MTRPVALVTGGSRGIGRAICIDLAHRGWNVAINYRTNRAAALETLHAVESAGAVGVILEADIAAANDRESLLTAVRARFDRLDTLVNNAGIAPRTRLDLLETTPQSFDEVMNTNLRGPFLLTQAVARWMIAQPRLADLPQPSVINIGSISAYTVSLMRGEYCMAKAALGMMTALFAARLAEHGIGVYEVRPGIIQTDMTTATLAAYERMIADGLLPVRRVGQPEDVARAVGMLASGELPYSSGEVINVDGGFHLRRL